MADRGFVRLGDCEPGTLVEPVAFQTQWLFTGFVRVDDGTGETHELSGVGTDEVIHLPADALVYPLTAVRLHPSLAGSELWGLVRRWAAEPGDVTAGVLLDALADHAGRDPDVAAAVRERCARVAEGLLNATRPGVAAIIRDRIRALGRPAATAAACGRCGGDGWVEPSDGDRDRNVECPACGGTKGGGR